MFVGNVNKNIFQIFRVQLGHEPCTNGQSANFLH